MSFLWFVSYSWWLVSKVLLRYFGVLGGSSFTTVFKNSLCLICLYVYKVVMHLYNPTIGVADQVHTMFLNVSLCISYLSSNHLVCVRFLTENKA